MNYEKYDKKVRSEISKDKVLISIIQPFLEKDEDPKGFIVKSLENRKGRSIILRLKWFLEIANGIEEIKPGRPALKLIFIMALIEGVSRIKEENDDLKSIDAINKFFELTNEDSKKYILENFKSTITEKKEITFDDFLEIIYDIRSRAVHGNTFWEFSFMDKDTKEKEPDYFSFVISGYLKSKEDSKKKRITLDIKLTYDEFEKIIIDTVIRNIKKIL